MKNKLAVLLALLFVFSCSLQTFGQYAILTQGGRAKVLRVIDGDSIEVTFLSDNSTALVHMIGIDAQGYDEAFTFLTNELLGKTVSLSFDQNIASPVGRWNQMYVYLNQVLINRVMLERGYAKINEAHRNASMYGSLLEAEQQSQNKSLGTWAEDKKSYSSSSFYTYSADCVNINTATSSQLQDLLVDVNSSLARRIITYRNRNPFNTIGEIKFVDGFTKELFDRNKESMTVCTNIERASEKELRTLRNLSDSDVERIIDYRSERSLSSIETLYREELISRSKFDSNEPFIAVKDVRGIEYALPDIVVNANTTSAAGLVLAGLSSSRAERIIDYGSIHPFRSFGEIEELLDLSSDDCDRLEDNIKTATDYNYSERDYVEEYINLNTATWQQFRDLGLTSVQADRMVNRRKNMLNAKRIPITSDLIKEKGVLFTNINRTTVKELETLDTAMTSEIIYEILRYTEDQPFGSMSELRDFFEKRNQRSLYNSIRDFVVLR